MKEKNLVSLVWAAIFIWCGMMFFVSPERLAWDLAFIGVGIILVALNVIRFSSGFEIGATSSGIGIVLTLIGIFGIIRYLAGYDPVDLPFLALGMVTAGLIMIFATFGRRISRFANRPNDREERVL